MNYVGKVLSTVSEFYNELNPATLSGAIDIIAVERPDGSIASTPFHVRFGKLQLLRPSDKRVEITVNGHPTEFSMKVGEDGEAFFVVEVDNPIPSEYITSPISSPKPYSFDPDAINEAASTINGGAGYITEEPDTVHLPAAALKSDGGGGSGASPQEILNHPQAVFRIDGQYYTWQSAAPLIVSRLAFGSSVSVLPVSEQVLQQQKSVEANTASKKSTRSSAWSWLRGSRSSSNKDPSDSTPKESTPEAANSADTQVRSLPALAHSRSDSTLGVDATPGKSSHLALDVANPAGEDAIEPSKSPRRIYAKTLNLTSEQLRQLNLRHGRNEITFTIASTKNQRNPSYCSAAIYLWHNTASIVVSDIDGTITRSDGLGHFFHAIGQDWSHLGIANLYTDVVNNGYQLMYLTSRAIGQADTTRNYLRSVQQGDYRLPEGPVIMSPDRLFTAFHREVIMRQPQIFKMACLRSIRKLFVGDRNPFYAGFGNRFTDAVSYRHVEIPTTRIFTIDYAGDIRLELSTDLRSSYPMLTDSVDQIFPPIGASHARATADGDDGVVFSDFNFWK
ncbi:LNS2-domain-containing protein, partial [Ramicandelaber brevisporus]